MSCSVGAVLSVVPYEMTIDTGDVDRAGTDAQVFIKVFGKNGTSSDINLDKASDRFERAHSDLIKVCNTSSQEL